MLSSRYGERGGPPSGRWRARAVVARATIRSDGARRSDTLGLRVRVARERVADARVADREPTPGRFGSARAHESGGARPALGRRTRRRRAAAARGPRRAPGFVRRTDRGGRDDARRGRARVVQPDWCRSRLRRRSPPSLVGRCATRWRRGRGLGGVDLRLRHRWRNRREMRPSNGSTRRHDCSRSFGVTACVRFSARSCGSRPARGHEFSPPSSNMCSAMTRGRLRSRARKDCRRRRRPLPRRWSAVLPSGFELCA